jgi:hypothetical protein
MEITFDINEEIVERLRKEADRCGETMSSLVESALRTALPQGKSNPVEEDAAEPAHEPLPPLPTWNSGGFLVDISNREELYRALDEAEDSKFRRLYGYQPQGEMAQGEMDEKG